MVASEDYHSSHVAERADADAAEAGISIVTFHIGREAPGGNAIAPIEIDGELPADVLAKVRGLPQVQHTKPLKFCTGPEQIRSNRCAIYLPPVIARESGRSSKHDCRS